MRSIVKISASIKLLSEVFLFEIPDLTGFNYVYWIIEFLN